VGGTGEGSRFLMATAGQAAGEGGATPAQPPGGAEHVVEGPPGREQQMLGEEARRSE
jgi:hypothetical protein